jgi:hypothetical protein
MADERNVLRHLPIWASHWLGYRESAPPKRSFLVICVSAFLGSFSGLLILLSLFTYASYFVDRGVPSLIASYVRCSSARSLAKDPSSLLFPRKRTLECVI